MSDYLSLPTTSPILRSRGQSPASSPPLHLPSSSSSSSSSSYLPTTSTAHRYQRRKPSLTSRGYREGLLGGMGALARRRRLWMALGIAAIGIFLLLRTESLRGLLLLARFKLRDRAFEEEWFSQCGVRKKPLIFVRGDAEAAIVWEMSCATEMLLEMGPTPAQRTTSSWWRSASGSSNAMLSVSRLPAHRTQLGGSSTRFAYAVVLDELQGGQHYSYRILNSDRKAMVDHAFFWHSSSSTSPDSVTIMAVADNQYNLRVFHRLLRSLLAYSTRHFQRTPTLLLHAGDATQNPHNLAQWQTDFFDPLTSLLPLPFGQSTPILQARGNHDWDSSGENVYSGGSPPRHDWHDFQGNPSRPNHLGTFFAFSPHRRARIVVLDSNLGPEDQEEQEKWLAWELNKGSWKDATLRVAVVHVPPFLEYWDREAWTGGESQWSIFVRHRLAPLLSVHSATLIISGHQHAYSRGFLPTALDRSFTAAPNSSSLHPLAIASARERGWEKAPLEQKEAGVVYTIIGGAGGTLDTDRVEEWGFYEQSLSQVYHGVLINFEFGRAGRPAAVLGKADEGRRCYHVERRASCPAGSELVDVLSWDTVGLDGKVLDKFRVETESCVT